MTRKFGKNKKLTQETNNNEYDIETKIVNDVIYNGIGYGATVYVHSRGFGKACGLLSRTAVGNWAYVEI